MMSARAIGFWMFVLLIGTGSAFGAGPELSDGQTLYVPVYSHIYGGPSSRTLNLAATLSVRNTDPAETITVTGADYYDTAGRLVKKVLNVPAVLGPMSTWEFIVPEQDEEGGSGANFIVRWTAKKEVNTPLVEAVMISTRSGLGISFTSRGKPIRE
ncbi:MAG: DUF3124 domain-containing protein [Thermodesulfobacteriota bacterium]